MKPAQRRMPPTPFFGVCNCEVRVRGTCPRSKSVRVGLAASVHSDRDGTRRHRPESAVCTFVRGKSLLAVRRQARAANQFRFLAIRPSMVHRLYSYRFRRAPRQRSFTSKFVPRRVSLRVSNDTRRDCEQFGFNTLRIFTFQEVKKSCKSKGHATLLGAEWGRSERSAILAIVMNTCVSRCKSSRGPADEEPLS